MKNKIKKIISIIIKDNNVFELNEENFRKILKSELKNELINLTMDILENKKEV